MVQTSSLKGRHSAPRQAKAMPSTLPRRPSQTATMTPAVSTRSEANSARVGVLPSMLIASTAVATGMADLQGHRVRVFESLTRFLPWSLYSSTDTCTSDEVPEHRRIFSRF